MYHFFTDTELFTDTDVTIAGPDVNHIKNVLRMKPGERVLVSDGKGLNRFCKLTEIGPEFVRAEILEDEVRNTELPVRVTLYQGLPKVDKMELIIQKCVELGVFRIVPVSMSRCVVKLDAKKETAKIKRWEGISESAAKQSKRLIVPEISGVVSFKEALEEAKSADCAIVPYEDSESLSGAGGMKKTRTLIAGMKPGSTCAVFIGPEGGFSPEEIELAMENGVQPVTLGNRILRTETAGIFVMAAVGFMTEE